MDGSVSEGGLRAWEWGQLGVSLEIGGGREGACHFLALLSSSDI